MQILTALEVKLDSKQKKECKKRSTDIRELKCLTQNIGSNSQQDLKYGSGL